MSDRSNPSRRGDTFRNGLHSGAGALTGGPDARKESPTPAPTAETEEWVNEGGSLRPPHRAASFAFPSRSRKAPADTVDGCRERAAFDLVAAAEMETANGRLKHEHSAASWTTRADLLQRLDDGIEARRAAAYVIWQEHEARNAPCRNFELMEAQHVRL